MTTSRLNLLTKLINRHNSIERECGRHRVCSDEYERATAQLGWFLSYLPELIQQVPWLLDYHMEAGFRVPSEVGPRLHEEAKPFEEYLILGFLRGQSVDEMVTEFYELEEED